MALLWYQVCILWVELVHRASAGVEVACILELYNPPGADETTKSRLFNTYKRGI